MNTGVASFVGSHYDHYPPPIPCDWMQASVSSCASSSVVSTNSSVSTTAMFFPFSQYRYGSAACDPIGTPSTPYVISGAVSRKSTGDGQVCEDSGCAVPVAGSVDSGSFFCPGPDFVKCVTSMPVMYDGLEQRPRSDWGVNEWKAFAEHMESEAARTALRYKHYKEESKRLGVELGTCIQMLQIHTENREHAHRGLMGNVRKLTEQARIDADTIQLVRDENMRLASLLSTHLRKSLDYDAVKARLDQVMQEKAGLEEVMASMSETLSGFIERGGGGGASVDEFCSGFFVGTPGVDPSFMQPLEPA